MKTILIQLDTDPFPSTFDRVVAIDAGVDELFSYGGVTPENVTGLVHGGMFTRGPNDLKNTAIFVGGSQVKLGEAIVEAVRKAFFGPIRMSVMMDSNGSNTTAAAAVRAAAKHVSLSGARSVVLGGTGPVGLRSAELLASEGAQVTVVSRYLERAEQTCRLIQERIPGAQLEAAAADESGEYLQACRGKQILIAAGAAGAKFLTKEELQELSGEGLGVAIDLNAVPPAGLGGIEIQQKGVMLGETACYGAIGVGGSKMKIHKEGVKRLFTSNDQVLLTSGIYEIAKEIS